MKTLPMKRKSISKTSKTDWVRLKAMADHDIDFSDIPPITVKQLARATFRVGGKPVIKSKIRVNLLLDAEVLAYFKAQSRPLGKNYQAVINDALKESILSRDLEAALRQIIREELRVTKAAGNSKRAKTKAN